MSREPDDAARRIVLAPVEVNVSELDPAELRILEWRGKPVWILRRTPAMLERLASAEGLLADPRSEEKPAARIREKLHPLHPAGNAGNRGAVYAPGLYPVLLPGAGLAAAGLAGRLLLPVPRLQVRSRRARVPRLARTDQSRHPTPSLRVGLEAGRGRGRIVNRDSIA
jgi:hypothetical protein